MVWIRRVREEFLSWVVESKCVNKNKKAITDDGKK